MGKLLKKEELKRFLNKLKGYGKLYAPIQSEKEILRFKEYDESLFDKLDFSKNTRFSPIKHHLMPQKENMFNISGNDLKRKEKIADTIVFGAKHCDLTSLPIMDKFFGDDPYYAERREKLITIGMECRNPSEYCFCESMNMTDGHDLFFYELDSETYYIDVATEKGKKLVSGLKDYALDLEKLKDLQPKCTKHLEEKDFAKFFSDPAWEKAAAKCLSCGMCNNLCPTCLCFDIHDEMDLNLKDGKRVRVWDYCHSKDFTKVAGNHVFRPARQDRFRHRIYHKLQYFKDRYGIYMCTGCGRCIEYCPTKIDFVEVANTLK